MAIQHVSIVCGLKIGFSDCMCAEEKSAHLIACKLNLLQPEVYTELWVFYFSGRKSSCRSVKNEIFALQ